MSETTQTDALLACEECGAAHPAQQFDAADASEAACPHCGDESLTPLRDPSRM